MMSTIGRCGGLRSADGKIEFGSFENIAIWTTETNYDGPSLYPSHVFFLMAGTKDGSSCMARNLKAENDELLMEAYRESLSLPFAPGDYQRAAGKIIDDRDIERLKIAEVGR